MAEGANQALDTTGDSVLSDLGWGCVVVSILGAGDGDDAATLVQLAHVLCSSEHWPLQLCRTLSLGGDEDNGTNLVVSGVATTDLQTPLSQLSCNCVCIWTLAGDEHLVVVQQRTARLVAAQERWLRQASGLSQSSERTTVDEFLVLIGHGKFSLKVKVSLSVVRF